MVTSETAQFFATGMISWSMKFTYKDGKVKRTASQFTPTYEKNVKNWTAQRNLNLYQQLGSKTLAYTIKNGDVVQINKIIFKDFKVYFQVINKSGKIGYLTCPKTFQSKNYFKELYVNLNQTYRSIVFTALTFGGGSYYLLAVFTNNLLTASTVYVISNIFVGTSLSKIYVG